MVVENNPWVFPFCWKKRCYFLISSATLSVWGRLHLDLSTRTMGILTGTRMWRSGCRIRTDGIFHHFLVTLCFQEFTQQKVSCVSPSKKVVLRETWLCGTVLESIKQLLTSPTDKMLDDFKKESPGCGVFLACFCRWSWGVFFTFCWYLFHSKESEDTFSELLNTLIWSLEKQNNLPWRSFQQKEIWKRKMGADFFKGV